MQQNTSIAATVNKGEYFSRYDAEPLWELFSVVISAYNNNKGTSSVFPYGNYFLAKALRRYARYNKHRG